VSPEQAAPLIARGARIDIWAAANLGMMAELADWVASDPALVHAKGGDGKRPLHFARTIQIARFLLEHGAEIDALDEDHDSTRRSTSSAIVPRLPDSSSHRAHDPTCSS